MQIRRNYGYQAETFKKEVGEGFPYLLIGAGLMPRKKYDENNAPTDEIASMVGQVYYPKKGILDVKFPADYILPTGIKDMSRVKLINPQACVMNGIVYGKADGIEALEEDMLSDKKARSFLKNNILKYTTQYNHQDGTKNLLKAEEYLQRLIAFEERKCVKERQSQMKIKEPSPVPTKNTPIDKIIELSEEYYPWLLQHPEIIMSNVEIESREDANIRMKAVAKVNKFREKLEKWCYEHVGNEQLADNEANTHMHASCGDCMASAKFKVWDYSRVMPS
jgi:hypothetical protein